MVGNCPPLPGCEEYWGSACTRSSGTVYMECGRARTLHLFVSSLEPIPVAWMSQHCICCPLAAEGGAALRGEEPESSPESHKESARTREHSHLKTESSFKRSTFTSHRFKFKFRVERCFFQPKWLMLIPHFAEESCCLKPCAVHQCYTDLCVAKTAVSASREGWVDRVWGGGREHSPPGRPDTNREEKWTYLALGLHS